MAPKDNSVSKSLHTLVPDQALRTLMDETPDHPCTLIVEADLPKRTFTFSKPSSMPSATELKSGSDEDRETVLSKLADDLQNIAGKENMNVLKTSGSIVIKVLAKDLKEVSQLSNVKAIRPNRRLPPIKRMNGPES